jgi:hypothetical protein
MNILLFSMPDSFEHMPAFAIRLPFVDAFRNELTVPSRDILGTFAAVQDVVYT